MEKKLVTKRINEYQAGEYKLAEQIAMEHYLDIYKELLKEMAGRKTLSILDVGGGRLLL